MKRQIRNLYRLLSFLIIPFLVLGCSTGTSLQPTSVSKKSQVKQTPTDNSSSGSQTLQNAPSSSTQTTSTSQSSTSTGVDSAACISTRTKMTNLYGWCRGLISAYASSLGGCASAVSYLTDTQCNGIDSRLASFKSACNNALTQYRSIIASENPTCLQAIDAAK